MRSEREITDYPNEPEKCEAYNRRSKLHYKGKGYIRIPTECVNCMGFDVCTSEWMLNDKSEEKVAP